MKKHIIPLDDLFRAIDNRDFSFYSRLTDEQKKDFSMWTAIRWATYSDKNQEYYIMAVNGIVNRDFSAMTKHVELQWKLLAACGAGEDSGRRTFMAPPKKEKKNRVLEFLRTTYPEAKNSDLEQLQSMLDKEELVELAKSSGLSDKEIKEILK